jgi:hypothetical protein
MNMATPYPLSHSHWTQKAHDTEVFFGSVTFTKSEPCTNGALSVSIEVSGPNIPDTTSSFSNSYNLDTLADGTYTRNLLTSRPFLFEPGANSPRTATATISDDCDNGGEDVTVNSIKILPVTIR